MTVQGTAAGQIVVDGFKRIVADEAAVGNLLPDAVKELLLVVGREARPAGVHLVLVVVARPVVVKQLPELFESYHSYVT